MGKGYLKINLYVGTHDLPVKNARVIVEDTQGNILYELMTDENGITDKVILDAPDIDASMRPDSAGPAFSLCNVEIPRAGGFKRVIIKDVQIFDTETSILPVLMQPAIEGQSPAENTIEIHIPYKHGIDEPREEPLSPGDEFELQEAYGSSHDFLEGMAILANEVRVPDYITVHLGSPNAYASNVRVPFVDYIKNVASSEIFPTWEESALYANIYAQISFALNRVYTVWYRSRGFDFDITNSTAFDQSFQYGRNIFENISRIVDGIFNNFLRRRGRREPFFASYCNGTTVTCDGLSQWGSQDLALRGYSPLQILREYYPNDVSIVESNNFSSQVGTYPGSPLKEGSSGSGVLTMQLYLNRISGNFYIPNVGIPDGVFGSATKNAVIAFQNLFDLVPDGIIGKSTWYAITRVYVGVTELAELTSEGERIGIGYARPTETIQMGARGELVVELQFLINFIAEFFPVVPFIVHDGVFRDATKRAVIEFQKEFGLTPDGVVGPATWKKLYDVFHAIEDAIVVPPGPSAPQFPGTPLKLGSTGSSVLLMQNYLNAISKYYPAIPALTPDGIFGPLTQTAVKAFQREFGLAVDGIIGESTWNRIVSVYNNLPPVSTPQFPGTPLRVGSRGDEVRYMQSLLSSIARIFPVIPGLTADGVFGAGTQSAVIAFQKFFGLEADGIIGRITWDKIIEIYSRLPDVSVPAFPGAYLKLGSRGNDVIIMQKYLAYIARSYPSIPVITADGVFGAATEAAVKAFPRQFGLTADGVIGIGTWNQIVSVYNMLIMNLARVAAANIPDRRRGPGRDKLAMLLALKMLRGFYPYWY